MKNFKITKLSIGVRPIMTKEHVQQFSLVCIWFLSTKWNHRK